MILHPFLTATLTVVVLGLSKVNLAIGELVS